jgi:hypothetical protein
MKSAARRMRRANLQKGGSQRRRAISKPSRKSYSGQYWGIYMQIVSSAIQAKICPSLLRRSTDNFIQSSEPRPLRWRWNLKLNAQQDRTKRPRSSLDFSVSESTESRASIMTRTAGSDFDPGSGPINSGDQDCQSVAATHATVVSAIDRNQLEMR